MKKVSLLAASVAIALSGCGGSDGGSSDEATPGGIVITAIDGYLENAQVWIDTNGNLKLDSEDKQLDSNTNENGEITLPNEYKDKAVFIKAIAGQTIDKTRGLVNSDFELATTAGATVVSPMTNMVVEQMEANSSLTLEQSRENVVKSITDSGLEASDTLIFGDYIADESQEAEALNVIGETLVDNSTISVEQQLQLTNSIAEETKKIIDDPTENLKDFSPVVEVPEDGGAPIVTPNSRPTHDQADGHLNPVVIIKGDAWAPIDTSLNFSDAESDTLTYELKELTGTLNGLNIDSTTGVIGGKLEAAGEFNYQIFAKDAHQSLSYPLNLKVTVEADNTAPVLNKAEQARLQLEEIDTWYLQEGEAFSQDIDISNLFTDADGHIRRTSVGLGGVVPGLSSDTDLENLIITISGTPDRPWNQAGKITISVTDNDGAESEESLLLMPHVLEGAPIEPPAPELGFTEAHFNNQEWKMGSFAPNDGEIAYASLMKNDSTGGLKFCWGATNGDNSPYEANIGYSFRNSGLGLNDGSEIIEMLSELDDATGYLDSQEKDCWPVSLSDGKLDDGESRYEMLYQKKTEVNGETQYQILVKIGTDELFWLDSTNMPFAHIQPVENKVNEGIVEFDLMVESEGEDDSTQLTYSFGQYSYDQTTYDYDSVMPEGFHTPGEWTLVADDLNNLLLQAQETGEMSDYKTRFRYIGRDFGDFYIGMKWSREPGQVPGQVYQSAPEYGLFSIDKDKMFSIVNSLPMMSID